MKRAGGKRIKGNENMMKMDVQIRDESTFKGNYRSKKWRQKGKVGLCTYNLTLRLVRATTVAVDEQ